MQIPKGVVPDLFSPAVRVEDDGLFHARNLVNGVWKDSTAGTFDLVSPVDGTIAAKIPVASAEDVDQAIEAAYAGQNLVRDISAIERIELFNRAAALLERHREFFRFLLLVEAGKPGHESSGEITATLERLRMTMQEVKKITGEYIPGDWSHDTLQKVALVIHEPIGLVAAITSFNYPLYIPAAKMIPALLAGNSLVIKPASAVPLTLICFVRLLEEAGFPKGAVNLVTGSGEVGDKLTADLRIDMISFTGSTAVGKRISQNAGMKKLHLELGGKGVAIVVDDCDLDLAAAKCVEGSVKNAGQRCDAISAVLVPETVADQLVKRMAVLLAKWPCGDPRDEKNKVGPLINLQAARRIQGLVDDAKAKGAEIIAGGAHRDCYFEPTLLDHVPIHARIASEETFGPVITVIRVKDDEEALRIAEAPHFGLDSCVFTNDFYRMWKLAKRLEVGGVTINDIPRHGVGYFPFGGVNDSGLGREGIGYSVEEMTRPKTIVFNLAPAGLGKKHFIEKL